MDDDIIFFGLSMCLYLSLGEWNPSTFKFSAVSNPPFEGIRYLFKQPLRSDETTAVFPFSATLHEDEDERK